MKFLVPNYSCLQNPWLGGYRPQIPFLSVLNRICWTPPRTKFLGTPLQVKWLGTGSIEGPGENVRVYIEGTGENVRACIEGTCENVRVYIEGTCENVRVYIEGTGEIVHVLAVLFCTGFYCVLWSGFYLTDVPQLIVELRNVLPGFCISFISFPSCLERRCIALVSSGCRCLFLEGKRVHNGRSWGSTFLHVSCIAM